MMPCMIIMKSIVPSHNTEIEIVPRILLFPLFFSQSAKKIPGLNHQQVILTGEAFECIFNLPARNQTWKCGEKHEND